LVQFNKLRLSGFKSFVDSTELAIEPGLTGIVGPNGCGKSNLVEALRWAMGETSAKSMRGGEMDDVIFAGSVSRPGRNVAEVVLSLDNRARGLPAQFNDNDDLEISRRIERGSGSSYSVNGHEVRARDVQLLFADSATGAHSTALVSQGRVGAIINAKPVDRRALLEEAAGITGLHSRRHEAELRLRAAEANLSRLDDVIVTLESQLQALKKQARQATRYRNLNDHIRRVEATLLHLQWRDATARRTAAAAALAAAESAVAAATGTAAAAARRQADLAADLPALRQAEAEAAAELQRLNLARDGLDQEEARIAAALAEARNRLADVTADIEREKAMQGDAGLAESRLATEQDDLAADAKLEAATTQAAADAVSAATAAVEQCEAELARLTTEIAQGEAHELAIRRRLEDLRARSAKQAQRLADLESERAQLRSEVIDDSALRKARVAAIDHQSALDRAQSDGSGIEVARSAAAEAELTARAALQAAEAEHTRLSAEEQALLSLSSAAPPESWPSVLNDLSIAAGFEAALGAALGDDLIASTKDGAPIHWSEPVNPVAPPPLPAGAEPLSRFIQAPPALARRLSQIGVVADAASGRNLAARLVQGQRLVTRDGALWRWDGFSVVAGTPTASVTRLRQRARLNELRQELAMASAVQADAAARHAETRIALDAAILAERQWREGLQDTLRSANSARATLDTEIERAAAAASRIAALDQASTAAAVDMADLDSQLAESRQELAALPSLDPVRDRAAAARTELAERRTRLVDCRSAHDRLAHEAEMRDRRLSAIAAERQSWQDRAGEAVRQLSALAERRIAADNEIVALTRRPAEIAEQRRTLTSLVESASSKRRVAADRLAEAETAVAEAVKQLKQAETHLAEERENRVRAEAAVAQSDEASATLAERIRERLECRPEETADVAELRDGDELPDREATESRLTRLQRERENMGPVNLRAEAEASELEQQIAGLQSERSDLVNAVARLRTGIASLNREGRERLLAAFELVNGHFQKLFTRLFGGGHAHLKLTEAEDPLEAGLEIMASPPGKRLQVMSLLSGGEQALTALSLLFAVFLTNPAPICVLDEVDAPLDDANVDRFCSLVEELAHSTATRFLIITHHRMTMARMDRLFGVTMAERGVSQLVSVDLQQAARLRATA
jgi:chromosome segregation protein